MHGPMVFDGYWKRPDATAAAFIEFEGKRFFRSGDLGRMDEDGYFFITDRLKRMINASGFKVWPAEVEALMFRHPAIQEACVISAKDAYRGETVKAVVVLRASHKGQVSEQDIVDWCRENMAVYKVPRIVQFVDALPKSGSGKVMWRRARHRRSSSRRCRGPKSSPRCSAHGSRPPPQPSGTATAPSCARLRPMRRWPRETSRRWSVLAWCGSPSKHRLKERGTKRKKSVYRRVAAHE
jgi:hypothetical protein